MAGGSRRMHLLRPPRSTVADVSAIGATMIPPLKRAGYKAEQAAA
jgi:TRAP-type uncharacterized transport system fused permease subunit